MGEGPQLSHDRPTGVFRHVAHTPPPVICVWRLPRLRDRTKQPDAFFLPSSCEAVGLRREKSLFLFGFGAGRSEKSLVGAQHCCAPVGKVASGTTVANGAEKVFPEYLWLDGAWPFFGGRSFSSDITGSPTPHCHPERSEGSAVASPLATPPLPLPVILNPSDEDG